MRYLLQLAYEKLRHDRPLEEPVGVRVMEGKEDKITNDIKPLKTMVDEFITCSLHPGTVGDRVLEIVLAVQKHCHTRSCKKKGTYCRFDFPRFPSDETVICRPQEDKEELAKAELALGKVKAVLEDKDLMALVEESCPLKGAGRKEYQENRRKRIKALCDLAGVAVEDYKRYLKMRRSGYSVILQRDTMQRDINAYNIEWLRAWNGNLDLQPVLDFFAVITYVTEYAFKPEPEEGVIRTALEQCKDEDMKTQMKIIANTFQTARQMGEAEAVYKLIPSMTMTNATVKCQWVSLVRDDQKMKRMRRATEEDKKIEKAVLEIEDMEGVWYQQWDMRDKYLRRQAVLHHCCFSQFARMYVTSSKKKTEEDDSEETGEGDGIDDGMSSQTKESNKKDEDNPFVSFHSVAGCEGECCQDQPKKRASKRRRMENDTPPKMIALPAEIEIENTHGGEPKHMRKRAIPAALRFHKANKERNPHAFFLQELILYVPFGREENSLKKEVIEEQNIYELGTRDLLSLSDAQIEELYHWHRDHIRQVKSQIMPYLEDVEEERFFVEQARQNLDTDKIGDQLAPGKEQENLDTLNEELDENPDFQHLDPCLLEQQAEERFNVTEYGRIIIPNKNELREKTRKLDKDQRRVVDIAVKYAKDIVKAKKRQKKPPSPPHLMVHGAAGTGKSTVIDLVAQWCQSILQEAGDSPDQPYIIKCANIEGQTLTSAFHFQFGNKHYSLSDKQRDKTKLALKNLKIVIIDEISMVKADMLYQLDIKLQEIMEKPGVPFGGVLIMAFGDIFQLKPVCGKYIFHKPSNKAYHLTFMLANRWEMLCVINLETNHRQGEDGAFADMLNRLRFVKRGEMLPEDIATLEERVRPEDHLDLVGASVNIICTLAKGHKINTRYLRSLPGEEIILKAIHYKSNKKIFKPPINKKDGSVHTTGFMDELRLKVGAKVMMIKNVNTSDCLTNGQTGILLDLVKERTGEVQYLVVQFDREAAGRQARAADPQLTERYPGGTKVERYMDTYSLSKKGGAGASATLIQFPIRLAHAVTAHKTQGQTIHQPKTSSLDLDSVFEAAQGYVMLGRNQALSQVYISGRFDPNKVYASSEALEEYEKMNKRAINKAEHGWFAEKPNDIKVVSPNIARLGPHIEDVQVEYTLLKADIIHLCETWVKPGDDLQRFQLPGYQASFLSVGAGIGIVTYSKDMFEHRVDVINDRYQATMFSSATMDSIHVYRSSNGSIPDLRDDLKTLINKNKATIISGDFNICLEKDPNNLISRYLTDEGFIQMVTEPTHIDGGLIDHFYLRNTPVAIQSYHILRHSTYVSDHDALCVTLTKTEQVIILDSDKTKDL